MRWHAHSSPCVVPQFVVKWCFLRERLRPGLSPGGGGGCRFGTNLLWLPQVVEIEVGTDEVGDDVCLCRQERQQCIGPAL